jgi:hypothetical protein
MDKIFFRKIINILVKFGSLKLVFVFTVGGVFFYPLTLQAQSVISYQPNIKISGEVLFGSANYGNAIPKAGLANSQTVFDN